MKRSVTRCAPASTTQPRKSPSTRTIGSGAPSIGRRPAGVKSFGEREDAAAGRVDFGNEMSRTIDDERALPGAACPPIVEEPRTRHRAERMPDAVGREEPSSARQRHAHRCRADGTMAGKRPT